MDDSPRSSRRAAAPTCLNELDLTDRCVDWIEGSKRHDDRTDPNRTAKRCPLGTTWAKADRPDPRKMRFQEELCSSCCQRCDDTVSSNMARSARTVTSNSGARTDRRRGQEEKHKVKTAENKKVKQESHRMSDKEVGKSPWWDEAGPADGTTIIASVLVTSAG